MMNVYKRRILTYRLRIYLWESRRGLAFLGGETDVIRAGLLLRSEEEPVFMREFL
jgi:hypothetical protein